MTYEDGLLDLKVCLADLLPPRVSLALLARAQTDMVHHLEPRLALVAVVLAAKDDSALVALEPALPLALIIHEADVEPALRVRQARRAPAALLLLLPLRRDGLHAQLTREAVRGGLAQRLPPSNRDAEVAQTSVDEVPVRLEDLSPRHDVAELVLEGPHRALVGFFGAPDRLVAQVGGGDGRVDDGGFEPARADDRGPERFGVQARRGAGEREARRGDGDAAVVGAVLGQRHHRA